MKKTLHSTRRSSRGAQCLRRQHRHRDRATGTRGACSPGCLRAAARAAGQRAARLGRPASSRDRCTLEVEAIGGLMVLVDTSVWIRFLAGRAPYANPLADLLGRGEVSGHDFVYGELLMGDPAGRRALLTDFAAMHRAPMVPHTEVVAFVRQRRLHGRGVGGSTRTCSRRRWSDVSSSGPPTRVWPPWPASLASPTTDGPRGWSGPGEAARAATARTGLS